MTFISSGKNQFDQKGGCQQKNNIPPLHLLLFIICAYPRYFIMKPEAVHQNKTCQCDQ